MKREELIKKWLGDKLDPKEKIAFDHLEDSQLMEEIVAEASRFKKDDITTNLLHEKVNERIQVGGKTKAFPWIQWVSSVAAILLISIILYQNLTQGEEKIRTQIAEQKQIYLPDSSVVRLNALSEITYTRSTWEDQRVLNLKGEAFFDVEKGNTFKVNTVSGTVTVLGTEFNVKVIDSLFEVVCFEGSVQINSMGIQEILSPGQRFQLKKDQSAVSPVFFLEPSWMNHMSSYKNAPYSEVLKGLEKEFNIDIQWTHNSDEIFFSGAFYHDNLLEALEAITQPLNLTFEIISDDQVIIKNKAN